MKSATGEPAYLHNPVYAALTTAEARFAVANGVARRFQPGIIPFAGMAHLGPDAFADLLPLLTSGEEIYVTVDATETIRSAEALPVVSTLSGFQMRFAGIPRLEEDDAQVLQLTDEDKDEMLDLKSRAFPGFFGPRAIELGSFFGIRDPKNGRLVAMGGERLATHEEREVSAVCTDPEHVGRGYGARIVRAVLWHQARLGIGSILHVTAANTRAISLYEHLGFRKTGSIDFVKLRRP